MIAYEQVCLDDAARTGSSSSATSIRPPPARWSARSSASRSRISKRACAARDRTMPEEINRLVTDAHRRPAVDAVARCRRESRAEGVAGRADRARRQHHDRQLRDAARRAIEAATARASSGLRAGGYGVVTLHRPVERRRSRRRWRALVDALVGVAAQICRGVPGASAHRAAARRVRSRSTALAAAAASGSTEPLGYIEFMSLVTRRRGRRSPIPAASRRRRPISASPA